MKRIYLAGPMTGRPQFNYPAFSAEAARLRALGFHVENPAENPKQPTWEAYMRQALRQMLTCDWVAVLPDWMESKGANIEVNLARRLGMEVLTASTIKEAAA